MGSCLEPNIPYGVDEKTASDYLNAEQDENSSAVGASEYKKVPSNLMALSESFKKRLKQTCLALFEHVSQHGWQLNFCRSGGTNSKNSEEFSQKY